MRVTGDGGGKDLRGVERLSGVYFREMSPGVRISILVIVPATAARAAVSRVRSIVVRGILLVVLLGLAILILRVLASLVTIVSR